MSQMIKQLFLIMAGLFILVSMAELSLANSGTHSPLLPRRSPAQRAVILKGTRNTRDLGGLPIRGGYFADGLVYRSGALCFINAADIAKLNKLHIKTVIDLRAQSEREREGLDKAGFAEHVSKRLHLPIVCFKGTGREAYFSYLDRPNHSSVLTFFRVLGDRASLPLLFHCSAGKDRTGILTALLLMLMGTERSVITDDYLQSMRNAPKLKVHEKWLGAVFQSVDKAEGIENYLQSFGVNATLCQKIRSNLSSKNLSSKT